MLREPEPLRRKRSLLGSLTQLGANVIPEVVVVGSTAVRAALGDRVRAPQDLDLGVTQGVFAYLREQPGWLEQRDGLIRNGDFDVGIAWGQLPMDGLQQRSWRTGEGIAVASLADVYTWKQQTDRGKDRHDTAMIRKFLLDPGAPPLSTSITGREIAIARSTLPEHLQDAPEAQDAIRLAGNGLHIVYTLYGDPSIGSANHIIGDLELEEYGVPALYHNGFHLAQDLQLLQTHFNNVNAPDEDRLDGMVTTAYSDSVYGNGRRSSNPEGYDEKRSGELLEAHALYAGYAAARADRLKRIILGTGFDETTKAQAGKFDTDPVVQAVAGVDLQGLSEPDSIEHVLGLLFEDGMSARVSPDRIIGRVFSAHGVRIFSVEGGAAAVDLYSHERPNDLDNAHSVGEYVMDKFVGQALFHHPSTGHEYPPGWTLGNDQIRTVHAEMLVQLRDEMVSGLSFTDALSQAKDHTVFLTHTR